MHMLNCRSGWLHPQPHPPLSPVRNLRQVQVFVYWFVRVEIDVFPAEFDQFLQQRSQQAESLPPARHRAQMQRKDDQATDELFAL